ncbi:unnamed protein product [Auanema sp. JU1783]|nr:unnamed protein product [Auanema sp. JU1783]
MTPTEPSELHRCSYILPKKGRSCRMLVKAGNKFCGEHAVFSSSNEDRIPCPNDPKHTVARTQLASHLKVCNSRLPEEPWIKEGFNCVKGETRYDDKIDLRPTAGEISAVIDKINKCHDTILSEVEEAFLEIPLITEYLEKNQELNDKNKKHLVQIASIIGHLTSSELLRNNESSCLFELGAGKAQLSYWMAKQAPKCKYFLMDRSGSRNKYDNKAIQEDPSVSLKRIRCSIEHLDLSAVDSLKGADSLSAVCKHFCGSATDAGIRCLLNGVKNGLPLDGFVLVPCCHHKSRLVEYCGQEFLKEWGIESDADYAALRHVASWANCGFSENNGEKEEKKEEVEKKKPKLILDDEIQVSKLRSGRKAKILFEMGRARYISKMGFKTKVLKYTSYDVSPENLLILATA